MNRIPDLAVPYILHLVTASPTQDTEEHRQSPVPSDIALYVLSIRQKCY
jgi:hypothetical protein